MVSNVFSSISLVPLGNAFKSMCFVLRVEPLRLNIPGAAEELQHRIWCVVSCVSALHPNFNNQYHCCRKLMPSQAPDSAATNSASSLPSAIVDCFLLEAVIGYQPSLPCTHDAVPLTLNRSASQAQSESPYVSQVMFFFLYSWLSRVFYLFCASQWLCAHTCLIACLPLWNSSLFLVSIRDKFTSAMCTNIEFAIFSCVLFSSIPHVPKLKDGDSSMHM